MQTKYLTYRYSYATVLQTKLVSHFKASFSIGNCTLAPAAATAGGTVPHTNIQGCKMNAVPVSEVHRTVSGTELVRTKTASGIQSVPRGSAQTEGQNS